MNPASSKASVAAIVVTCNRLSLLKECIQALRSQTRKPDEIIVIDNASTDETPKWLAEQKDLTVVRQENLGSSGGQYTGIKTAYQKQHDWFWCMDDDTIPHADALEKMTVTPQFTDAATGFIASLVLWTDGTPHRMNSGLTDIPESWYRTVLVDKCVRMRVVSFVSVMLSRVAVEACGLPLKDMFLWFDDYEYTDRITRKYGGYLALESVATHKTKVNQGPVVDRVTPETEMKFLCSVRNRVVLMRCLAMSSTQRFIRIWGGLARVCGMIVRGRAPVKSINWFFKGLFFCTTPDHV